MRVFVGGLFLVTLLLPACSPAAVPPQPTPTDDWIVVGKDLRRESATVTAAVCVRYRLSGHTEETCLPAGPPPVNARWLSCYNEATVGRTLPDACR